MGFDLTPKIYSPKAHKHSDAVGDGGMLSKTATKFDDYSVLYDELADLSVVMS